MKIIATIVFSLAFQIVFGQEINRDRTDKVPSYFGLQVRTIFPTAFIGNKTLALTQKGLSSTTTQTIGYGFGASVRVGLTKLIALETGLNFNQRNYKVMAALPDSGISFTNKLSYISYELPINCLVYIQLSKQFYMNTSLGFSVNYKPTNVGLDNIISATNEIYHTSRMKSRVFLDFNANVGFEFRTKKDGFFYLGGSAKVPYQPLFEMLVLHKDQTSTKVNEFSGNIDGSFLSLEFKYFFPNIRRKETPLASPIE